MFTVKVSTGEAKSRGWVGRGRYIRYIKINISSLSARSKFVLGLRSYLFQEFPVVDLKKG